MSQMIQLNLSDDILHRAREVAARTNRNLEDVLIDWIHHAAEELPVESLPDDQVLALADLHMDSRDQRELTRLLVLNRESQIDDRQRVRLDALMQVYRHGMTRKAQALKVAVERGLKPPLSQH